MDISFVFQGQYNVDRSVKKDAGFESENYGLDPDYSYGGSCYSGVFGLTLGI